MSDTIRRGSTGGGVTRSTNEPEKVSRKKKKTTLARCTSFARASSRATGRRFRIHLILESIMFAHSIIFLLHYIQPMHSFTLRPTTILNYQLNQPYRHSLIIPQFHSTNVHNNLANFKNLKQKINDLGEVIKPVQNIVKKNLKQGDPSASHLRKLVTSAILMSSNNQQQRPSIARATQLKKRKSTGGRNKFSPDGAHSFTRHQLPNGRPPMNPLTLLLSLTSPKALDKIRRSTLFKQLQTEKVRHLYQDVLRQLTSLMHKFSRKKLDISKTHAETVQIFLNKISSKGGQLMKLKWPLVMLHPEFLRELLSSPTFLVMLFHAVEVAYMSTPMKVFLKPFVKLVEQRSPQDEERIWWRRKRLYDTLNGHGSSELQPNLRSIHFKQPGKPTPIAFPSITNYFRRLVNKPPPDPTHYKQPPPMYFDVPSASDFEQTSYSEHLPDNAAYAYGPEEGSNTLKIQDVKINQQAPKEVNSMTEHETSSSTLPSSYDKINPQLFDFDQSATSNMFNQEDWLYQMPRDDQIMSKEEFAALDPRERDLVLKEARQRFEESNWTNDIIKQHTDLIESFINPYDRSATEMNLKQTKGYHNSGSDYETAQADRE